MVLESIRYEDNELYVLNQLLLPGKDEYIKVSCAEDGWNAIKKMQVRGAPAIAIVAALSLAVEIKKKLFHDKRELGLFVEDRMKYLISSRPTAVNIKKACEDISALLKLLEHDPSCDVKEMNKRIVEHIEKMLDKDVSDNKSIGKFGAECLVNLINRPMKVLTHCNTGSLATAGYGTALGVVRSLAERNMLENVFCTETRPYNQGSRLTAFELKQDKLPVTLICDSMVGALMRTKKIDAVIVGADRVASNGDTANKIGTYQIAILAKHHSIPFFIAAPTTSIDFKVQDGSSIPIEYRDPSEIQYIQNIPIAPSEVDCWNPAFDVTPASLISGIITELGVYTPEQLSLLSKV